MGAHDRVKRIPQGRHLLEAGWISAFYRMKPASQRNQPTSLFLDEGQAEANKERGERGDEREERKEREREGVTPRIEMRATEWELRSHSNRKRKLDWERRTTAEDVGARIGRKESR